MFNQRLRYLRKTYNLSQEQLAKALSLSASAIGMYEQGRRIPDITILNALAQYFNVSTDFLLGNTDIPNIYAQQDACIQMIYEALNRLSADSQHRALEYISMLEIVEHVQHTVHDPLEPE